MINKIKQILNKSISIFYVYYFLAEFWNQKPKGEQVAQ